MVANSGKQLKIYSIASVAKTKFKVSGAVVFLPFITLIRNLPPAMEFCHTVQLSICTEAVLFSWVSSYLSRNAVASSGH